MSDEIRAGDEVLLTHLGQTASGTVKHICMPDDLFYVRFPSGMGFWVHKDKLTRITDSALVAAVAALPQDDQAREQAISDLRRAVDARGILVNDLIEADAMGLRIQDWDDAAQAGDLGGVEGI